MYTLGSLFYAIYFFVSFPMFFRMDESPRHRWTLAAAFVDALAAGMAVTCLLDFWRLTLGAIWQQQDTSKMAGAAADTLPWLHEQVGAF